MSKSNYFIILLLTYSLAGCVNLDAVGKFAEGANMLSQASSQFYKAELATDRKLAGLTVDLSKQTNSTESAWLQETKGENLIAETRRNQATVTALAMYAENLKEIANFESDEALAKSTAKFSSKLNSLSKEIDSSSELNESALAKAFLGLANLYTDVKTRAIIKQKVKQAHPFVTIIINTMVKDIERQQTRFSLARLSANVNRERWFNSFKKDYQSGNLSASQKSLITIAAGHLVENELEESLSVLSSRNFLKQLKKTATSCLAAHQAIRDTDLKDNTKELLGFVSDAKKLLTTALDVK